MRHSRSDVQGALQGALETAKFDKMINITVNNGVCFIWNEKDVRTLRQEHHIVGALVGCLPRAPRQNRQLGLPLQLMPEEATLLHERGIGRLVEYNRKTHIPGIDAIELSRKIQEDLYQKHNELFKLDRHLKITRMADQIVEGKLKKLKKSNTVCTDDILEREMILKEEHSKVEQMPMQKSSAMVQLFIECPWYKQHDAKPTMWSYPQTEEEMLKYCVFKDLLERGYYVTTGGKFGGDFLVYPGDPLQYHAFCIAICTQPSTVLSGFDIITKGRLGTIVKKFVLFCGFKEPQSRQLKYLSLKWAGMK